MTVTATAGARSIVGATLFLSKQGSAGLDDVSSPPRRVDQRPPRPRRWRSHGDPDRGPYVRATSAVRTARDTRRFPVSFGSSSVATRDLAPVGVPARDAPIRQAHAPLPTSTLPSHCAAQVTRLASRMGSYADSRLRTMTRAGCHLLLLWELAPPSWAASSAGLSPRPQRCDRKNPSPSK